MFNYGFDVFSCLKNNPTISMYLNSPSLSGGLKVQTSSAALGDIFDVEVVMNFIHNRQGDKDALYLPHHSGGSDRPNTTFGICMYS